MWALCRTGQKPSAKLRVTKTLSSPKPARSLRDGR
jgi:hypothetical protein